MPEEPDHDPDWGGGRPLEPDGHPGAATSPQLASFLALLAVATVILVLVGLVGNRFNKQRYPIYWW
jgi:hypothetical protein